MKFIVAPAAISAAQLLGTLRDCLAAQPANATPRSSRESLCRRFTLANASSDRAVVVEDLVRPGHHLALPVGDARQGVPAPCGVGAVGDADQVARDTHFAQSLLQPG